MSTLDLNLISLYRLNGQELPLLPGLLAQNPPRKTAHGRDQDRLLVYLTLAGNVTYSSDEYSAVTALLAERFYNTAGSLTFALKTTVEALNTYLVERNMKTTGKGQYSIGALVLAALRGNSMYIVQSGPTHAYWLMGDEARHFHDSALAGKGLGLSQTARMYFAQANLNSGNRVLFCAALPPNWDAALIEERGAASLEATRRRLLAITQTNVSAVLFQIVEGSGAITILQPGKELATEFVQQVVAPPVIAPAPAPVVAPPPKVAESAPKVEKPAPSEIENRKSKIENRKSQIKNRPESAPRAQAPAETEYSPEPQALLIPQRSSKLKEWTQSAAHFFAKILQSGRMLGQKISSEFKTLTPRLLPGNEDEIPTPLPGSWMFFMSIAVPVVVVTIALNVYWQLGIPEQYNLNFQRASESAQQAHVQQSPVEQRKDWKDTLTWLDSAEQFNSTEASKALRQQAQNSLDELDHVLRVKYQLAFDTKLNPALQVTHMAATDTEIYLLDNVNGNAIRGSLNGTTYTLDSGFTCVPGIYNGVSVGHLVDIVALPRSNPSGATLLGIDKNGMALYCTPGQPPKAITLQMPDVGWKQITSIAFDANNLYLLDAPGRAVWVYYSGADVDFTGKPPYFFFESQIPNALTEAIGIAINGDDMYLLHADGHLTTCTLSRLDVSPTRCTDPAIFIDTRKGYESGPTLADGVFSQIAFTGPAAPSVALLEKYNPYIFRFSAPTLELQNQIQPEAGKDNPLPVGKPITAMAYGPNKVLFIFVGGQVYFSINVP